ncbi:hypothetical protein GCS91_18205 [Delftia tsuruhatensis]|nr:hypothetical protein GCS91_18205 [Delftia tsuruhatensis]
MNLVMQRHSLSFGTFARGKGYRTFKVYRYAQDSTYVFSLAPDSTVWKIGLYTNRSDKSIQSNVDAMQMFYDNFGRPVLEEDISVGGTISTLDGLKSFGKLVFKHAWATSHLRVANTTSSQAPAEQLCSLPSWQDDPLAKNCGDSYNP